MIIKKGVCTKFKTVHSCLLLSQEIPVEFEAFPPTEEDFSGIRCLLQQVD